MLFYTSVIIEIAASQKHFREVGNNLTDIKLFFQKAPQLLSFCCKNLPKGKDECNSLPFFHQSFFFSRREKRDTGFKFNGRIN